MLLVLLVLLVFVLLVVLLELLVLLVLLLVELQIEPTAVKPGEQMLHVYVPRLNEHDMQFISEHV